MEALVVPFVAVEEYGFEARSRISLVGLGCRIRMTNSTNHVLLQLDHLVAYHSYAQMLDS